MEALDRAGIRRAVVLSDAYYFGTARGRPLSDEAGQVRAENDWTAAQVGEFPERLVAFCSFNPLKDYAMAELDRCASSGRFRGLKLHFGGAQLDFDDAEQVAKVRRVMEAANRLRLPMIIHVRSSGKWGREHAEIFLHQLVAAAPDVPITVAHLWGGENYSESALAYFADAVSAGHRATKNLYFDVAECWLFGGPREREAMVRRMRQIGLGRILYGSDAGKAEPRESWAAFAQKMPLTDGELRAIAGNVAPYLRGR
ncbi:MAG TPA: amidohydrolase family protein [Polyangia bacterium]|nr:amidohydrolase family protein [Polyangia bacterium]